MACLNRLELHQTVIPAQAGIQRTTVFPANWIPAFAGMTLVFVCVVYRIYLKRPFIFSFALKQKKGISMVAQRDPLRMHGCLYDAQIFKALGDLFLFFGA